MPKSLQQVLLLVALAAFSVWMFWRSSDRRKINLDPYQALGAVVAEETSKLLGHKGTIILAIPDPGADRDPVMDAQVGAFQATLKKAGKVQVRSIETIVLDPFQSMRTGGAVPPERIVDLLKKHPDLGALVLFLAFPALDDSEIADLKTRGTKCVVASAALPTYDELLKRGVLHLAIVPRTHSADQALPVPQSLREVFEQEYQILNSDLPR